MTEKQPQACKYGHLYHRRSSGWPYRVEGYVDKDIFENNYGVGGDYCNDVEICTHCLKVVSCPKSVDLYALDDWFIEDDGINPTNAYCPSCRRDYGQTSNKVQHEQEQKASVERIVKIEEFIAKQTEINAELLQLSSEVLKLLENKKVTIEKPKRKIIMTEDQENA